MAYSDDKLLTFDMLELRRIMANAQRYAADPASRFHNDGVATLRQLEELGIKVPAAGVTLDSPAGKLMQRVIFSPEGRRAAMDAAKQGKAPMEPIDVLLQAAMGADYSADNGATVQAGYLVANLMRQEMWEVSPNRRAHLPDHCIAKTAALYTYIPSKR